MNTKKENVRNAVDEIFEDAANGGAYDIISGLTLKKVRSPIDATSFQTKSDVLQMIICAGAEVAKCYIRKPSQDSRSESFVSEECFYDLVNLATQYGDVIKSIDAALAISNHQARKRRLDEIKRKHPNCTRISELIHLRESV